MITNVVCTVDTNCDINLRMLVTKTVNIIYDPSRYSGAQWKHPKVGGHCMVFSSGKLSMNGRVSSVSDAKRRVRRYARQLQQLGWQVRLSRIPVATMSGSFKLESTIHLDKVSILKVTNQNSFQQSCLRSMGYILRVFKQVQCS